MHVIQRLAVLCVTMIDKRSLWLGSKQRKQLAFYPFAAGVTTFPLAIKVILGGGRGYKYTRAHKNLYYVSGQIFTHTFLKEDLFQSNCCCCWLKESCVIQCCSSNATAYDGGTECTSYLTSCGKSTCSRQAHDTIVWVGSWINWDYVIWINLSGS